MVTGGLDSFVRRLVRDMTSQALADQTDRQLVERLWAGPDEAVFEALIRRHGPMVFRACWRVLQHTQDAEDAFQATFLVLAQRLGTVRKLDSLAGWLHEVAHRVSLDAQRRALRRRKHENRASGQSTPPQDGADWREVRAVLDAELSALTETHRLPLILCYLEGLTQDEAARQLGWSKSTLLRRLEAARAALGRRLSRKGFAWSIAGSAVLLTDAIGLAAPESKTICSTATVAVEVLSGRATTGILSANVLNLAKGAVTTMFSTKLALAAGLLVAAAVGGGHIGVTALSAQSQRDDAKPAPIAASSPKNGDPKKGAPKNHDPKVDEPNLGDPKLSPIGPAPTAIALPPAARPALTPAQEWAALKAEYDADLKANTKAQIDNSTGQPIPNAFEVRQPGHQKYADRLLALGRSDDEPTAVEALSLAVTGWVQLPHADQAFDLLLERFADSPRLAEFARKHHAISYPGKYRRLERLLGVATDPTARGISLLDLGLEMEPGRAPTEMPDGRAAEEKRKARAAALYRRVIADYPDVVGGPLGNGCHLGKLGRLAQAYLLRLEPKCRDGMPAPPTAGKDLDGKPMALTDFKGQIVVLDFWGSWCTPCRAALPALKDLAVKYADRGVIVLGVASENAADDAMKAATAEKLPWRNWFDRREENDDSPIVTAWGITTFPTVAVLDREGNIRFLKGGANAEEVANILDALLAKR
jgi:RNA polymerase sigma factor (sigma-70 family)